MTKSKNVGIWIRVSTDHQVKDESPEHHEKRARQYAEIKGWKVKKVYRLNAISGKSVMDFPETQEMLVDVYNGKISGLIFSKLARLARNTKELLEFSDIFQEHNADLISLGESIDTSTPAGRLFYTLIAALGQWEREEIAERTAAMVPIRAKMGKSIGGVPPFGYKLENKKLVIDPEEAPVRKLMFELYLEIKRMKTVAKELNERGYRTRTGTKFCDRTIKRLLTDPVAKGRRRMNYTRNLNGNGQWVIKPKEDWIFVDTPAIVDEDLWNNVNAIIDEQRKKYKPSGKTTHLFSGFIHCHCGGKMYVPTNMKKYVCMKCRSKIGEEDMEEIFMEQIREFVSSDRAIHHAMQEADNKIREKQTELNLSIEKSSKLKAKLSELIELHHKGEIPTKGFGAHYKPVFEQMEQIEEYIPKLQAEIDNLKIERLSGDQVIESTHNLHKNWPKMTLKQKRSFIEIALEKIVIEKDEIIINLAYLPKTPHFPKSPITAPSNPFKLVANELHTPARLLPQRSGGKSAYSHNLHWANFNTLIPLAQWV